MKLNSVKKRHEMISGVTPETYVSRRGTYSQGSYSQARNRKWRPQAEATSEQQLKDYMRR
jgi:hypothetical protein